MSQQLRVSLIVLQFDDLLIKQFSHQQYALDGIINIIGGCCGTTPAYIKLIREVVLGVKPRKPPVNVYKVLILGYHF